MSPISLRRCLGTAAAAVALNVALSAPALADTPGGPAGMPTQATVNQSSSDPGSAGPGWGDMAGGVAARPYVVSMSVTNGGVTTPVITDGTTAASDVPAGAVTAVVSPLNLCAAGQTPSPGVCYATPNRVGLTVAYGNGSTDGWDFSNPVVPVSPAVDSNSVIDMTVGLNTLGRSLRWTWVNGDLLYWQTHNLGQADATVRIKFRPATAPWVASFPARNACTATPPFNCEIPRADGQVLAADVVFSLDNTLDPSLTGAAFATQGALSGYLTPGGTATAPSLDLELASTHQKADGTPQLGTLQAFIPASVLINLYGVLPSDSSSVFTTTRLGDPGSNDPPSYVPWTAGANGSDGLLVTVTGVTFSLPSYQLAAKLRHVRVRAMVRGARTMVRARIAGCSRRHACVETLYDLGPGTSARFGAHVRRIVSRSLTSTSARLNVPASRLRKGDRFLLVVRLARSGKLLYSSLGSVS